MPSSIAKREKLIGPVQLALIAALFAITFIFLLPEKDALKISEQDENNPDTPVIGELDLAYLKAHDAVGQRSTGDTSSAIAALVKSGQIGTARKLLEQRPETANSEKMLFSLDLEMATADYFAANSETQKKVKRIELLNRIELLLAKPELRTVPHLERAAQLSSELQQPDTSVALFNLLAETDTDNAVSWFEKCARAQSSQKKYDEAIACYNKALALATSEDDVFELRLAKLTQLTLANDLQRQDEVITQLTTHQPLSIEQREKLANTLLANQRPEYAYLAFDQLAKYDEPNRAKWLLEAAKWAQASNQSMAAANYIDQAAELTTGVEKIALLEKAEALLIASGKNDLAFNRIANRIKDQPDNAALLRDGVVIARQIGENGYAARWNQRLLAVNPTDIDAVNSQIALNLANRDLPGASKWSKHAVSLSPNDLGARKKLAEVSEWNGDPIAAQREWAWIAKRYPDKNNLEQLVRLANLNRDSKTASAALRKLVWKTPVNDQNISHLIELYELEGAPTSAASMLTELEHTFGARPYTRRKLAKLYQRHLLYPEALAAWSSYATDFGRSAEETLNRMELHWRLNQQDESAEVAKYLIGSSHASEASAFQVFLISEIAWRYRLPELAELVRPHMDKIEKEEETLLLGKRLVQSLQDSGKNTEAIAEATQLWQQTRSDDMAFVAMNLAFKTGKITDVQPLLADSDQTTNLRKTPDYWIMSASIYQKNGDKKSAVNAFKQALSIEPTNVAALNGLLWNYIDEQDVNAIATFIEEHQETAETQPELWSAFAVAHLQLGLPELSLTWFDRQLERIDADYNMLLTYADALEYAGRAEPARKVRLYAIKRLRPVLTKGTISDQGDLVRQYAQLLNIYGSAEDKENLAQAMLGDAASNPGADRFWREDIAISWLMATQRHEHARMVMAKLHARRLQAPAWQKLSLAMAAKDLAQIKTVLAGTGPVSVGNHILALRQIGHDQRAYTLAKNTTYQAPTKADREIARSQYGFMRSERPSYSAGNYQQISMNGLGIAESGFTVRHSFENINAGFAVRYSQQKFSSDTFLLGDNAVRQDIAFSLFHGDRQFGGKLTAGYSDDESEGLSYALTRHHLASLDGRRTLSAELAYNEPSTASALLRLAAKQNRLTLGYEQALGAREYVKLQANVSDINTRVQQNRVARGLAARLEFGIRGAIGSNVWSTNIVASRDQYDVSASLPAELALSPATTINSILTDSSTSLTLGASISRGGVDGAYPLASSPRYYLNANVGHVWPQTTFGAQFEGGAGIRILGGDELSIGFSHDTQPLSQTGNENDTTGVGVNYRFHF